MMPDFSLVLQAITAVAVAAGVFFTYRTQSLAAQAKIAADAAAITAAAAQRTATETKAAVAQVAISIDGNLHKMLELTEKSARAEGLLEGQNTGRTAGEAREDLRAQPPADPVHSVELPDVVAPVAVEAISVEAAASIASAMKPGMVEAVADALPPHDEARPPA